MSEFWNLDFFTFSPIFWVLTPLFLYCLVIAMIIGWYLPYPCCRSKLWINKETHNNCPKLYGRGQISTFFNLVLTPRCFGYKEKLQQFVISSISEQISNSYNKYNYYKINSQIINLLIGLLAASRYQTNNIQVLFGQNFNTFKNTTFIFVLS